MKTLLFFTVLAATALFGGCVGGTTFQMDENTLASVTYFGEPDPDPRLETVITKLDGSPVLSADSPVVVEQPAPNVLKTTLRFGGREVEIQK
jgi:hypothetical protein